MSKMLGYTAVTPPFETEKPVATRIDDAPWAPRLLVSSAEIDQAGQEIKDSGAWCGDCHSSTCQEKPGAMSLLLEEGISFSGCPIQNDIPQWLGAAARGNYELAYTLDARTNDIGDITGAACPADMLCQEGCMITQSGRKAPHIAITERSIFETAWANGWVKPIEPMHDTFNREARTTVEGAGKLQVSMIGTGVAVHEPVKVLLEHGADVTAYDGKDVAGGITHWSIPTTKLDRNAYRRHTERLAAGGAKYALNTRVGDTQTGDHVTWDQVSFENVAAKSDVIFIATGLQSFRSLPLDQEKQASFIQGIEFLETQNQILDGRDAPNKKIHNSKGEHMIVVGAGDTAWDVVGTGLRQEADKITLLIRRPELDGLDAAAMNAILDSGEINVQDKEIRSALEEAAYIAEKRGVALRDVLEIRLGTQISDTQREGNTEHLTLQTPDGDVQLDVNKVVLALGSTGQDLKAQFGFSNDNFQMKKGGRLDVTPYHSPEARRAALGKGSGHGGGLVGIYQTEAGRKVPVFAVGDVTRDDKGLDWSDEAALIVNAYRDGVNVLPDVFTAAQRPEDFVEWAEEQGLKLNYQILQSDRKKLETDCTYHFRRLSYFVAHLGLKNSNNWRQVTTLNSC